MMAIPSIKLNNSVKIPQIGLGLWQNKDEKECKDTIKFALEAGYRHIDTAQIYENEQFVGQVLNYSKIPRKELFITTKIWNDNLWWEGFDQSFEESLAKLQTNYVDLLLIHFPVTEERRPAWFKMEEKYKSGKAKAIGVSNYMIRHLEELLRESKVKPAVNQVELHVFLQQPELVKYCHDNDIVVEAYSPLAHGTGLDDPVLISIAKKHHKSTAQVMIRWCIEIGTVPLPKSVHPNRIQQNLEVFDFQLDAEDLKQLKGLEHDYRTCWDPTHVT